MRRYIEGLSFQEAYKRLQLVQAGPLQRYEAAKLLMQHVFKVHLASPASCLQIGGQAWCSGNKKQILCRSAKGAGVLTSLEGQRVHDVLSYSPAPTYLWEVKLQGSTPTTNCPEHPVSSPGLRRPLWVYEFSSEQNDNQHVLVPFGHRGLGCKSHQNAHLSQQILVP